jgi:hypothetical protein
VHREVADQVLLGHPLVVVDEACVDDEDVAFADLDLGGDVLRLDELPVRHLIGHVDDRAGMDELRQRQ